MNAAQVSASSCLCALLGAGLATIKGILIDDILLPAKGKKNDGSDNCCKLTGGPSHSTRLQFAFYPSVANTCQWKTGLLYWHSVLPAQVHAAPEKGVPFPCGTHETYA